MPYLLAEPFSDNDIVLEFGTAPAFLPGETLVGGTSGAVGQLYGPLPGAGTHNYMVRYQPNAPAPVGLRGPGGATFASGEVVTGQTSGATGTLSANEQPNGAFTCTSPSYGPMSVDALSMFLASIGGAHQASAAGTMKVQVSNDVIKLANYPNVQPVNWFDMPLYNSIAHVATMAAGANVSSAPAWPLLSWRWYRFVWTPSYTANPTYIRATVCFNTRTD